MNKIIEFLKQWKETFIIVLVGAAFFAGIFIGNRMLPPPASAKEKQEHETAQKTAALEETVLPRQGFKTKIVFGDAIQKLIGNEVIDREKFEQLYKFRGGLTPEQKALISEKSETPITINNENSQFLLNLLWPLGIANKSETLRTSEAADPENVNNLASTGGWILGKSQNGGDYYNKFEIVKLTQEQDTLVKRVAETIYRPCCGNSTAFPDCNHGAAMLGMLTLGAAQGLNENELYKEAVKFNSFWFPDEHMKMALMFQNTKNQPWNSVDPRIIVSDEYSSGRGFRNNVMGPLSRVPGALPETDGGGSCGV